MQVPRAPLLAAVAFVGVGSFLPWIDTAFGTLDGLAGAGLWTLYAAAFGVAALVIRAPRLAGAHALAMAVPAILLPLWQVVVLLPLGGFGSGWTPGVGLVAVFGGGVLALRTGWWALRP